MTTIAWDGSLLAGDRQATYGGTPLPVTKIWRATKKFEIVEGVRLALFGCCGLAGESEQFRRWVMGELPKGQAPAFTDLIILAVDSEGRAWSARQDLFWAPVGVETTKPGRIWAIGSGADFALGAMLNGATSSWAVEIASRLDVHTGLGCDTLRV